MKKEYLLTIALVCAVAQGTWAQAQSELRHELSLSYGFGSTSQLGDGIGEGISSILSGTEYDDGFVLGPISAEYFYHFNNPRLAVGGIVSYSKWDSDILMKSGSHEKVGERNRNYIAVMPAVKWYWINKNSFGLYSKGAMGAAFLNSTEKSYATDTSNDDNGTYLMFQLSFIGAEFGKQFRGFAELGVGEQGFVLAGLRYKF